jgi:hypothetical protein
MKQFQFYETMAYRQLKMSLSNTFFHLDKIVKRPIYSYNLYNSFTHINYNAVSQYHSNTTINGKQKCLSLKWSIFLIFWKNIVSTMDTINNFLVPLHISYSKKFWIVSLFLSLHHCTTNVRNLFFFSLLLLPWHHRSIFLSIYLELFI